jgi:hypothetical protein
LSLCSHRPGESRTSCKRCWVQPSVSSRRGWVELCKGQHVSTRSVSCAPAEMAPDQLLSQGRELQGRAVSCELSFLSRRSLRTSRVLCCTCSSPSATRCPLLLSRHSHRTHARTLARSRSSTPCAKPNSHHRCHSHVEFLCTFLTAAPSHPPTHPPPPHPHTHTVSS